MQPNFRKKEKLRPVTIFDENKMLFEQKYSLEIINLFLYKVEKFLSTFLKQDVKLNLEDVIYFYSNEYRNYWWSKQFPNIQLTQEIKNNIIEEIAKSLDFMLGYLEVIKPKGENNFDTDFLELANILDKK